IGTWKVLLKEASYKAIGAKNGWTDALRLAKENYFSMCKQEQTGVPFDEEKGWKLVKHIDGTLKVIADSVEPRLPMRVLPESDQPTYPAAPFNRDGALSADGWKWIRKLGYKLNEDAFNKAEIPAKPFKMSGEVSVSGLKFMDKNSIETPEALKERLIELRKQNDIEPLMGKEYDEAIADLKSGRVPVLEAVMKLSNQLDIKVWLYNSGWRPTIWGTKDATKKDKENIPKPQIIEKLKKYIEEVKGKVWKENIYLELGINLDKLSEKQALAKLEKKARYLVTSPKFKDEKGDLCVNLEILEGDMAKQIVEWLSRRNRRTTLLPLDEKKKTGWLNNPRLKIDGRLPARASGLANTTRQKHHIVCNVPKADPKVILGKEFRSLFYAPKDWLFLGWDGAALEQRVACWYCWKYDDGWYFNESMTEGIDFHEKMASVYREYAPNVTRSSGKNVTYAILYGCAANKLANMLGISVAAAQKLIDGYWETNWSLKILKDKLEKYWERTEKKYILGVDGRKIYTRSKHSLLNCLFQSTGAVVMDLAHKIMRAKIKEEGLCEVEQRVLYVHDEYQHLIREDTVEIKEFESKKEAEDWEGDGRAWSNVKKLDSGKAIRYYSRIGEIATESIEAAGTELGSPLPITASYDVGRNWSETH
ncbi:MAG: DNA polymerase, partial [Candidatus Nezhaarchaeales archaeon]